MEVWDRDKLRFCTVIFGGVRFGVGDCPAQIASEAVWMIEEWREQWRRAGNGKSWTGCIWAGQFEVDVVRGDGVGMIGDHREKLLRALGVDVSPLALDERVLVPHVHFAVGGNVERAHRRMLHHWQGVRQVVVKRLYAHQTVEVALTKIRGYCQKRIPRYVTGGWNGSYGSPVKFGDLWEPWVRDVAEHAYHRLDQSAHRGKHESRK